MMHPPCSADTNYYTETDLLIIGGGNTATDTAVTCRHCGAGEVRLVCLENPNEMPAFSDELKEARESGVIFEHCWGVSRIDSTSEGKLSLSLRRCLSVFNDQGDFAPVLDESCVYHRLDADLVVVAIGLQKDLSGLPARLLDLEAGAFVYAACTLQSPHVRMPYQVR